MAAERAACVDTMLPHVGQGANRAVEGAQSGDVAGTLQQYETFRRERTEVIQAESRRNGLRFDSRYQNLEQRDHEIKNAAGFRLWVYGDKGTSP